jgi:hypothetical protein
MVAGERLNEAMGFSSGLSRTLGSTASAVEVQELKEPEI